VRYIVVELLVRGAGGVVADAGKLADADVVVRLEVFVAIGIFLWFQLIFYSRSECFLFAVGILSIRGEKHFYSRVETFFYFSKKVNQSIIRKTKRRNFPKRNDHFSKTKCIVEIPPPYSKNLIALAAKKRQKLLVFTRKKTYLCSI